MPNNYSFHTTTGNIPAEFTGLFPFIINRPPEVSDVKGPQGVFNIGHFWLDQTNENLYVLVKLSTTVGTLQATWVSVTTSGTIFSITGNTGGAIFPVGNNINIVGSGNLTVAGLGDTLTISDSDDFFWNDNATTTTMVGNNGYIVQGGDQVLTLPVTCAVGDLVHVVVGAAGTWEIEQGAGQSIINNSIQTTVGPGGGYKSNEIGQSMKLLCVVADTTWQVIAAIGSPTINP